MALYLETFGVLRVLRPAAHGMLRAFGLRPAVGSSISAHGGFGAISGIRSWGTPPRGIRGNRGGPFDRLRAYGPTAGSGRPAYGLPQAQVFRPFDKLKAFG